MAEELKVLEGSVDLDYSWNPGSTVGRFLMALRDRQELLAVRCTKTSRVYFPPQAWSPYGNIKMDLFLTVSGQPTLKAGSIVYEAPWNMPEEVELPYMFAAISYPGVDTELLHIVKADEETLKSLKQGAPLKAVFKSEPAGNIRDLLYYIPVCSEFFTIFCDSRPVK